MLLKKSFYSLLLLFSLVSVFGQNQKDTTALTEVKIIASPIVKRLQETAASVSVIEKTAITKSDGVILTTVLNKIAGVYMQQGTLNTSRISIRGIGARSQYGTTKLKTYFDDIPLTNAEGESSIDDIDLETIGRIEIIKGPNATSFGAGLGGTIHLFSPELTAKAVFAKSNTTFGSYGLLKQSFSGGFANNQSKVYSNYSHLQSDGFRQNSAYDRKSFHLQAKQKISKNGYISFLGVFTKLKGYIPSSINETDFTNHPEKAAANWLAARGYESYDKFLFGISYGEQLSDNWTFKTSIFTNYKKAYEPRPFDILVDKTNSVGLRTAINYKSKLFQIPFEMSLGTEIAADAYRFSLFENLYASQPNQGSSKGEEFSNKNQKSRYQNYFLQIDFSLSSRLHLETGLAFNTTQYALKDLFVAATTPKLSYNFGKVWSPRAGLSYNFTATKTVFAAVSKGFSTPSVAETLTPDGEINTNLKPEIGWNYEVGFKAHDLKNKWYGELTFFSTQITNLLVARRTAEDQYIGINAGESSHLGVEVLLDYKLVKTNLYQLSTHFSTALNHSKFKDFIDGDNDYSGNQLTGVANTQWNLGMDFITSSGFSITTSYLNIGKIPMNDQNSKYSVAYSLLDAKTSYAFTILKRLKTTVSVGVNNITNSHYAASILPNAVGFGKAQPRYYYPGNPINYYGGVAINYFF